LLSGRSWTAIWRLKSCIIVSAAHIGDPEANTRQHDDAWLERNPSFDDQVLTDFDFAIHLVPEAYGTDFERHPCLQRLVAAKAASLDRLADSAFDFTLRSDADYLEKLADGHIEPIFVHARVTLVLNFWRPL
jgi:hypothetical protein